MNALILPFLVIFQFVYIISVNDSYCNNNSKLQQTGDWISYENVSGRFRIKFPDQPHYESINQRMNNQFVQRIIFTSHSDKETFQVSYYDLPINESDHILNDKNIDEYYDIISNLTASELNGIIISQSSYNYKNYKGREIKIDGILLNQKIKYVVRSILIGKRQYTLLFFTKPDTYRINLMYNFVNSFQTF